MHLQESNFGFHLFSMMFLNKFKKEWMTCLPTYTSHHHHPSTNFLKGIRLMLASFEVNCSTMEMQLRRENEEKETVEESKFVVDRRKPTTDVVGEDEHGAMSEEDRSEHIKSNKQNRAQKTEHQDPDLKSSQRIILRNHRVLGSRAG
ncbi:hypothetical protein Dimus_006662 [Dionaea muscipula]